MAEINRDHATRLMIDLAKRVMQAYALSVAAGS